MWRKVRGYGVKYYIDKDLLLTKLFSTVEMDGQWVYILYADDAVLQEYLELKQEEKDMIAAGTYTEKAQIDLATRYGKLMAIAMLILLQHRRGVIQTIRAAALEISTAALIYFGLFYALCRGTSHDSGARGRPESGGPPRWRRRGIPMILSHGIAGDL
mgnify:CR=1 FL=1